MLRPLKSETPTPRLRTLVALTVTAKGVGRGKIPESS